jgi:cellobiose phosphorylase
MKFWSPTWQPTQSALDEYTCRHGLGYTIITSTYQRVRTSIRYFVPLNDSLEIWQVTLANERDTLARLSIFSLIEFCLWDAQDDATNFQRNLNTGEVEVADGAIYHKTEYRERRNHFAYFACSEPLVGFDTQRDDFLGVYRGWDNPQVVACGKSRNSIAHGWAPIGSHHVRVTLVPNEPRTVIFVLGYHENPQSEKFDPPNSQTINKRSVKRTIAKYLNEQNVGAAFDDLRMYWDDMLARFQVETPDIHTNRMVNIWNAYQCMVTFNLSRSASLYESGIGRGMGFRDSNQDLLGFVHLVPQRARTRILDLAATQLESGGAYHQYQPFTKRGNDDIGSNFNDDPLWLILSVTAYIKETGNWNILDERVPYDNQPGTESPLYEHLQRSVQYTLDRLGPHGLPLIGRADWNDCLNLNCFSDTPGESFQTTTNKDGKIAESLMIAGLFVVAAEELAEIAARCRLTDGAARYRNSANRMKAAVLAHGWDGEWFLRAYDDFGRAVGSHECEEGKIFVEPQGWCMMAGIGIEDGRAEKALGSVSKYLATPHGIVLHQPAYSRYYLHLGEISSYPPGYKENAGVFCQTNPWVMIAETRVGHGDQAHDYYLRINPSARENISDRHRCEPYVYAQMIAGRDAPTHGEAKNSWLTGTAAWNYVAVTQWILGIRPTFDGLQIAPVFPRAWHGFTATRVFRGVTYRIEVERAGTGNRIALTVDGKSIDGDIVPLPKDGARQVCVRGIVK